MIFNNLPDILESGKHAYPKRTGIVFGSKEFSYAELHEKACLVARCLKEKNVAKGDRVAILLDNSPEFVFVYFGILMTGAIAVPINHMFKRDEIKYILDDSGAAYLVTHVIYEKTSEELRTMAQGIKGILYTHQLGAKDALASSYYVAPRLTQKNDLAVFLYTSGTTGHPKAAMLTHGNLLANIASSGRAIRLSGKDAVICFLPLFHSFAATVCMLMPLSIGGRCVIMKSPRPIKKLLRTIRKNKITVFVGIPSLFNILKDLKLPGWLPVFALRWIVPVRLMISGAAALPVEVFKKCEERFGLPLLEGYGLTEASPVVSLNPLAGPRKAGSIGLPLPDVRVTIAPPSERAGFSRATWLK
jgi:long-chain acyl-CoA synthetase